MDPIDSNNRVRAALKRAEPFMVGRLGLTEGSLLWHQGVLDRDLSKDMVRRLAWGVGLYPVNDESVNDLIVAQRSGALMADMMVTWGKHDWEPKLLRSCCGRETTWLHPYALVPPFFFKEPWTNALEGKRVLVVHPFADTIIEQYDEHREEIGLLPEFEMEVVEAPMTFGHNPKDKKVAMQFPETWAEALEILKDEVSLCEFDVALIGCGGYGLPLAGYIRMNGGKAIHIGGGLQLLFGIRGKRWDNDQRFTKFYNDAWVRPQEKPRGYQKVEGGCYW